MSKLVWDKLGEHTYTTGVDHLALYKYKDNVFKDGVAWNGVTAINESPSGAESTPLYADNIKYLNMLSAEEYGLTIEAYDSPKEFDECDGTAEIATGVTIGQQARVPFGLAYRTLLGNDTKGTTYGYELHLVYNCQASPSEKAHSTVNESPEATTLSWEVSTTPIDVTGYKPTACVTIDSTKVPAEKLSALEDILFGTAEAEPRLPLPDEIITLIGG